MDKKKRGRPATGRTTKVVRVPRDWDMERMEWLMECVAPNLLRYEKIARQHPHSVRNEKLIKLLNDIGGV